MSDREIANPQTEVPEFPEILEQVLLFCLGEAKQKLAENGEVVPFTALAIKDKLFMESHPADTVEDCFKLAQHTVQGAIGAGAYALCYDGYLDTDDGEKDALIAEGGVPGDEVAYALGYLYQLDEEDKPLFDDQPRYIGEAPNFMKNAIAAPPKEDGIEIAEEEQELTAETEEVAGEENETPEHLSAEPEEAIEENDA